MRSCPPPLASILLVAATLAACVEPFPQVRQALTRADIGIRDAFIDPPDAAHADMEAPDAAPRPEACNGVDDDFDGVVDEETPIRRCPLQTGVCANSSRPCLGFDGYGTCTYSSASPQFEVVESLCDGSDNDCDGDVDEGCECDPGASRICGSDVGACATGRQFCEASGRFGPCQNAVSPVVETCDLIDNDCDGRLDELPSVECETDAPGRCAKGRTVCDGGAQQCMPLESPIDEVCSGQDEDCDGRIDEDTGGGGCDTMRDGVCAAGRLICAQGRPRCTAVNTPGAEIEDDGLDNDCDGRTDERAPPVFDLADLAVGGVGARPGQVPEPISLNGALEPGSFQVAPAQFLDGAFSPSGVGLTPIDSDGTFFDFSPEVDVEGVGVPLAKGPSPAWMGPPELPVYDGVMHSIIELRPNTGLTFDIGALAAAHTAVPRALTLRFGNLGMEGIIGMVLLDGRRRLLEAVPTDQELAVDLLLTPQTRRISIVIIGPPAAPMGARTYVGDATVRFDVAD